MIDQRYKQVSYRIHFTDHCAQFLVRFPAQFPPACGKSRRPVSRAHDFQVIPCSLYSLVCYCVDKVPLQTPNSKCKGWHSVVELLGLCLMWSELVKDLRE